MLKYHHILLTTDLSEGADKIADRAKEIAKAANAALSVVHVVEHTPIVYGGGEFSIPLDINLEEALKNQARQALARLGNRIAVPQENQYVETGSVKVAVTTLAKKMHVDLILVGTHARHGIEKILGSTANAILHAAKCDVLTVRTHE